MKRRTFFLLSVCLLLAALPAAIGADQVTTKDGKKYKGRILEQTDEGVTIRTYADGVVTIPKSRIKKVRKSPSKFNAYDRHVKENPPKTAADHIAVGDWCKEKGLLDLAREHWRKATRLEPDNEEARKKLGDRREGDRWVTEEEYYKAKGMEKHEGKWIPAEEAKKKRKKKALGTVEERVELNVSFKIDAPKERLDYFERRVRFCSEIIWDMTLGRCYIEKVHIYDKAEDGHCVVMSLKNPNLPGGLSGRAKPGKKKFFVGGGVTTFVFVHEFFHAWANLPDHYGTKTPCIMNSSEMGRVFKFQFCDPCFKKVKEKWKVPRKPGLDMSREATSETPGKHGAPEDFGDSPPIDVKITDR
ncbi:MAG: LSm family protein [Planctomycetota bacterium]|jgi:hypothetical protein